MRLPPFLQRLLRTVRRAKRRLSGFNEKVVHLPPAGAPRGRVLLSFVIDGVLPASESSVPHSHTHFWETRAMAEGLRDAGFAVDVVHWTRRGALPRRDYDVLIDVRRNFPRHAREVSPRCLRICHMDTAHWRTNNGNQRRRLAELEQRSGIHLAPFKLIEENEAAETADLITVLGNEFTLGSFAETGKPVVRIPLSNPREYPFPDGKDFASAAKKFLWFGSEGFVHKGLDLVLEAFAGMPELELFVCGPLDSEPDFCRAFHRELRRTPGIHAVGWVDVTGPRFQEIMASCAAIVYPSCSEGGGGCVLTAMHAGVIPIVTREASVDLPPEGGILLPDARVDTLRDQVRTFSRQSGEQLRAMALASWTWARARHTRETFSAAWAAFVQTLPARIEEKRRGGP